MVEGNPAFLLEELQAFDIDQLRRICGYLQIHYVKKMSKKKLVDLIWEQIKPLPSSKNTMEIDGIEQPVSVQLARIRAQSLIEGDKPNEW